MLGQISNYENKLFISGQEVIGVENVEFSYSQSSTVLKALGYSVGQTIVSGPPQQKVSISQNLIHSGGLINYTGENNISGSINYDGNNYGFSS
jgi:hypothetical protein